ncbi:MAG: SHOCT domain-containing protein [Solirubrobacterales bacterium]
MRAAMVGGAGYAVGKRRAQSQEHEAQQDAAIEQGQPAQSPPAAGGGGMSEMDRIDALKKLGELHDSGVLTDEQFEAEKGKLI